MKTRLTTLALALVLFCFTTAAQPIDLAGNVSWFKSGSRIRIRAAQVINTTEFTTGQLRLQVWATTEPYDGTNDIVGYVVGTALLPRLKPGAQLTDISKSVAFRRPPAGYYYTTLTLEEKQGRDWFIIDSQDFTDNDGYYSTVNFGGFGEGSVFFDSSNGDISFLENVSWLVGNSRAQFDIDKVVNDRPSGVSGSLRIRLFASESGYNPTNTFYAYPLATKRLARLPGGGSARSVLGARTSYRPPPPGVWIITITLEEYSRGWNIRDYWNFQDPRVF
jgi:hypothetical protein